MSKTASEQSLSPVQVTLGATVRNSHVVAASRAVAYAAAYRSATVHISMGTTPGTAGGGVLGLGLFGAAGGAWVTQFQTQVWIDADTQSVQVGAQVEAPAATFVQIRWTIGGATATTSHDQSVNGDEITANLAAGSIGTSGWRDMTIETRCTNGVGATTELVTVRVQDGVIAPANLPDPT